MKLLGLSLTAWNRVGLTPKAVGIFAALLEGHGRPPRLLAGGEGSTWSWVSWESPGVRGSPAAQGVTGRSPRSLRRAWRLAGLRGGSRGVGTIARMDIRGRPAWASRWCRGYWPPGCRDTRADGGRGAGMGPELAVWGERRPPSRGRGGLPLRGGGGGEETRTELRADGARDGSGCVALEQGPRRPGEPLGPVPSRAPGCTAEAWPLVSVSPVVTRLLPPDL